MSLLPFIKLQKSFINSGLLEDMTDIHCHILPGVDDGISTYREAVEALHWLHDRGVRRIYLTPHVMSDLVKNNRTYLTGQFEAFTKRLEDDRINDIPALKPGAEYMLEAAFERQKEDGLITYADRHVLVETSYMMPPVSFNRLLEELTEDGYSPVLAHPERYSYMDDDDYKSLKQQGILFQLNFLSLTGAYGKGAREKAHKLLKEGAYDFAGSDFHRLKRHENSFAAGALTGKQIAAIRNLFDNNNRLW
jgi:tyrosine-protein phosphatase YwqE